MIHLATDPNTLLTVSAAAARLGICQRQLRSLLGNGSIKFVNVGNAERPAYRIRPQDVDDFIAERLTTCQKSEESINAAAPARGSMTSNAGVIDFVARRAQRAAVRPRTLSRGSATRPKAKSPSSGATRR